VKFEIATVVNRTDVLEANLLQSPDVRSGRVDVSSILDAKSAAAGYNPYLRERNSAGVVSALVHQDVYLPPGWVSRVTRQIAELEERACNWGVLGVWGIASDGGFHGRTWCTGSNREFVGVSDSSLPAEVDSIDEIVIIINPEVGLCFDEKMPGFHLYAADIARQASSQGYKTYAIDAPVVHNSRQNLQVFDSHFFAAYKFMQQKYGEQLPLRTCTVPITRFGVPLYKGWLRNEYRRHVKRPPTRDRDRRPEWRSQELGYEKGESSLREGDENG